MTDREKIRQALMRQLREQKSQLNRLDSGQAAAKRLAILLSTVCQQKGWSTDDLAHRLNIEPELAGALLKGLLPRSEIDDDFLMDIGHVIGYSLAELRNLLDDENPAS